MMSNPKITILVGPAGAGKSSLAEKLRYEGYVRVSQDDQGKEGHKLLFNTALSLGHDIVVDRLNFNKEQRARYIVPAKAKGYEVEIITLFVPYDVCLDRCLKREGHPTITEEKHARSALQTFFTKFERPTEDEGSLDFRYYNAGFKRPCVIVDLDGTMCNIEHRLHFVRREGKKDWKSFFSNIKDDTINHWCSALVNGLRKTGYEIVFCSGRPSDYREATQTWLDSHQFYYPLFMRPRGDHRSDEIVKEIILDFELLTRYKIEIAIDDRQRVVDLWRRRDIIALQCSKGDF